MSDDLAVAATHHAWSNVNADAIVTGWELANEWNRQDTPARWRPLRPDNPKDRQVPQSRSHLTAVPDDV